MPGSRIENQATGPICGTFRQEFCARPEGLNTHSNGFQQILDGVANRSVVIHYKDNGVGILHALSPVGKVN